METLTFNFNFDSNYSLHFGFYVEQHRELYDVLQFDGNYLMVFTKDVLSTSSFSMISTYESATMFFLPGTFILEDSSYLLNKKPLPLDKMFAAVYRPINNDKYTSLSYEAFMTYKKDGEIKSTQVRNGDFTVDIDPLFPSAQTSKLTSNRLQ